MWVQVGGLKETSCGGETPWRTPGQSNHPAQTNTNTNTTGQSPSHPHTPIMAQFSREYSKLTPAQSSQKYNFSKYYIYKYLKWATYHCKTTIKEIPKNKSFTKFSPNFQVISFRFCIVVQIELLKITHFGKQNDRQKTKWPHLCASTCSTHELHIYHE